MPSVPLSERTRIIVLSEAGVLQREIASVTGRPLSTINKTAKVFRNEQRLESLPRGSRSKALTDDECKIIVAAADDDPTLTAKEIQSELILRVSVKTIRNRPREAGFQSRVAAREPLHSAVNRQRRLLFVQERTSWSPLDWGECAVLLRVNLYDSMGPTSADMASQRHQVRVTCHAIAAHLPFEYKL